MIKPVILGIETATSACSVALLIHDTIIQRFQIAPARHAELILTMVDSILQEANIALTQLDAIAFGKGPGSFMGIRLAVGVAQGLGLGGQVPLIAVSTLHALAQTAYQKSPTKTPLLVGWDARMRRIYWGAYQLDVEKQSKVLLPILKDTLNFPEDIDPPSVEDDWTLIGNAWDIYQDSVLEILRKKYKTVLTSIYPEASAVAFIAQSLYREGKKILAEQAEPCYLRKTL